MAESKASLLEALQDEEVVNRFKLIFEPIFKSLLEPMPQKLNDNLKSMSQSIATLQKEGQEKDVKIRDLENEIFELKTIIDNHEQHGRRDSIRIFGLFEETSGTAENFMYRYICCLVPDTFSSFFMRNNDIHYHNTRTADHFHIPIVKTDRGKTGIKYRGAVIWNILIKDGINVDVSEAVSKKFLRKLVNDKIIP